MEYGVIVAIAIVTLVALLLVGVSVAISLATSGIIGLLLLGGLDITNSVIAGTSFTAVAKGSLVVVPMFVLMGMLTLYSGIAEQLFAIAGRLLKWIPGSLAMASVLASAGFGAISGSSIATVATMGRTCITEMMRHGYNRSFAAATVAASGTLAVLIPPSIILVLYGVITGESIGALLLAGIIPGILSALVLTVSIGVLVWRKPELINQDNTQELAVAMAESDAEAAKILRVGSSTATTATLTRSSGDKPREIGIKLTFGSTSRAILGVVVLFSIVIGGIYSGIFTPQESAAVGAFAAFLLICAQYAKRPKLLRKNLTLALKETATLNSMIFLILVGAGIFSYFLVVAGVPTAISEFAIGLPFPPTIIVIMLLLVMIPGGMFLDSISLLVITVPLVYQPIMDLGFDGIWLGILVVKLIEIGMITPPVGMNAFVAAGTTRGLEVEHVFKGLIPFYIADVATIIIIFMIPDLVTWLPTISAA